MAMSAPFHLTSEERHTLGRVALGKVSPDLVVRGGRVVNVFTRDVSRNDIWIWRNWIARITTDECSFETPVVDTTGKVLVPGLIDGHIHVESSLLDPIGYSKLALKCGVTSIVTDYHEVGVISGASGLRAMMDASTHSLMKTFFMIPMRLPFLPEIQRTLSTMSPDEAETFLSNVQTVGLSEVIGETILGVLKSGTPDDLRLITEAVMRGQHPEGHLFYNRGADLDACIAVGIGSDHELRQPDEVEEKIRKGVFVMLRSGTLATEVETLVGTIAERNLPTERVGMVTDDIMASDMRPDRYMLHKVRSAIDRGISPIDAIRMVTYNVAAHYRVDDLVGSLKPGSCADIAILDSLESLELDQVICSGRVIDDAFLSEPSPVTYPEALLHTIERDPIELSNLIERLRVPDTTATVKAIELNESNRFTELVDCEVSVQDGRIVVEETEDLCYLICANRRHNDAIGLGFLKGYGLREGALAVSMAHDHHNVVALGRTLDDLLLAANRVIETQGGLVHTRAGKIECEVPLPLAGLMATAPFTETVAGLDLLHEKLRAGGARWRAPVFFVFWLGMEVAPRYRITDEGVIDTTTFETIDVIAR
ncbi:adenine deaminase C-terminal domain-containing protein [Candidatus Bipolaricaulota bacterium]